MLQRPLGPRAGESVVANSERCCSRARSPRPATDRLPSASDWSESPATPSVFPAAAQPAVFRHPTNRRSLVEGRPIACVPGRTAAACRHRHHRQPQHGRPVPGNRARLRSPPCRTRTRSRHCRLRDRRRSAPAPCGSDSACANIRSPCARRDSTARKSRSRRSASSRRRWSDRCPGRRGRSEWRSRACYDVPLFISFARYGNN